MSPPSPADTAASLAALLDADYDPAADHDTVMCGLIAAARAGGLTWAQIGSVITGSRDPRLAKAHAKRLARSANRKAAAAIGAEVPGG